MDAKEFQELPIKDLELKQFELTPGRSMSVVLTGVARLKNNKHAVVDYILQFGQVHHAKVAVSNAVGARVTGLTTDTKSSDRLKFRIQLDRGAIELEVGNCTWSILRQDEFGEADERR